MTIKISNPVELNKAQERALQHIVAELASERAQVAAGHDVVISVDVHGTDYGYAWVKVAQDIPSLSAGNMLRFLTSADGWFIHVGPRGGMTAKRCPNYAKGLKKVGRINIG